MVPFASAFPRISSHLRSNIGPSSWISPSTLVLSYNPQPRSFGQSPSALLENHVMCLPPRAHHESMIYKRISSSYRDFQELKKRRRTIRSSVTAAIHVDNTPNVNALARSLTSLPAIYQQLTTYARACVQPGLDQFEQQVQNSLKMLLKLLDSFLPLKSLV